MMRGKYKPDGFYPPSYHFSSHALTANLKSGLNARQHKAQGFSPASRIENEGGLKGRQKDCEVAGDLSGRDLVPHFNMGLNRNDADGARNSFRRNVDLRIGLRGFRWVVLKHKTVLGADDLEKCENVGGKWTLLRTEVRAPAASTALFRLKAYASRFRAFSPGQNEGDGQPVLSWRSTQAGLSAERPWMRCDVTTAAVNEPGRPLTPSLSPDGGEGARLVAPKQRAGGRAREGDFGFMAAMHDRLVSLHEPFRIVPPRMARPTRGFRFNFRPFYIGRSALPSAGNFQRFENRQGFAQIINAIN